MLLNKIRHKGSKEGKFLFMLQNFRGVGKINVGNLILADSFRTSFVKIHDFVVLILFSRNLKSVRFGKLNEFVEILLKIGAFGSQIHCIVKT